MSAGDWPAADMAEARRRVEGEDANEPRVPKTFRLPRALVRELDTAAELGGVSRTSIVEEALRRALTAAEQGPGRPPGDDGSLPRREDELDPEREGAAAGPAAEEASAPAQSLTELSGELEAVAEELHERTGKPRAICRMWIRHGRVARDGDRLLKDGEPV